MSCYVDEEGEPESVHRETWPRARREHKCCACGETIRCGDRHKRTFVVFEGDAETYRHCLRCAAIYRALCRTTGEDEYIEYRLNCGHTWEETRGECPPEIARLAFMTPDEMQRELAQEKSE